MSAMSHTNTTLSQSLRPLGRITGVLYLIIIVGGMYAGFVRPSLTTIGDPGATAAAITASEGFFRSAILADLAMVMADVAIGVAFYYLLKSTHQGLALLSGLFRLAQAATLGLNLLMLFLVLQLLTGDVFAAAMGAESVNAMAYLFLTSHGIGYNLALVFFAFSILIQGYLFIKSDLFPSWLGFLVIAASLTYFVYTLASFFMPTFDAYAGGFEMMLVAIALPVELAVTIWLLVRGVRGTSAPAGNTQRSYAEAVLNAQ